MPSLSELNTTARPIRRSDDYLIYRDRLAGMQVWIVAMFSIVNPADNVRFIFLNRADAAQALWLEVGKPYSLPSFIYLLD